VPVLAVIALLLYVGCYQVSFGPISWLMVSEIFPLRTRGKALGVTTLVNFGSNAVVALAFAPLQDLVGVSATFVIFGIIGLISLIFIVLAVPETKGLSLEEIEAKLLGRS
jgi:MFS family permease